MPARNVFGQVSCRGAYFVSCRIASMSKSFEKLLETARMGSHFENQLYNPTLRQCISGVSNQIAALIAYTSRIVIK